MHMRIFIGIHILFFTILAASEGASTGRTANSPNSVNHSLPAQNAKLEAGITVPTAPAVQPIAMETITLNSDTLSAIAVRAQSSGSVTQHQTQTRLLSKTRAARANAGVSIRAPTINANRADQGASLTSGAKSADSNGITGAQ